MNKLGFVLAFFLIPSVLPADTVYLQNGLSFEGQLIRVTSNEVIVRIGDLPSTYNVSIIDLVVDETGAILFQDGKLMVSNLAEFNDTAHYREPSPYIQRTGSNPLGRGSVLLGGLISFTSSGGDLYESGNDRSNVLAVAPNVIYFLMSNVGLGFDVNYNKTWVGDDSIDELVFGPKLLLAFPIKGSVRPYVGTGIGLLRKGWSWSDYYSGRNSDSEVGLTAKGSFGIFFFLNEHYATTVELGVKFDRFRIDDINDSVTGNMAYFGFGFSGFVY